MKLEKIIATNYRGFEHIELEFSNDVTVLAGINGSGKSGILKALRHLLSFFEESVMGLDSVLPLESSDVQLERKSMSLGLKAHAYGEMVDIQLGRTIIPESEFACIQEKITKLREQQRYHPKRSSEAIGIEVKIEHLEGRLRGYDDSSSLHAPGFQKQKAEAPIPVFAFYSTRRAFTDLPKRFVAAKPLSKESAHANSLAGGRVNLNDFANWFRVALEGELGRLKNNEKLWDALQFTIESLLPEFRNLKLQRAEGRLPVFTIEKSGDRFSLNQLSDGERALLALATDLTQRLALANPDHEDPTKEGLGIVLIDEIELHLHPKWQRQVLRRLKNTFPKCQFIVTTHSPQVLGEVKSENIWIFDNGSIRRPSVSYADSNWILEHVLRGGAEERNTEVKQLLEKAEIQMGRGHLRATKISLAAARRKMGGEDGELVRLESSLETLEALAHEDD